MIRNAALRIEKQVGFTQSFSIHDNFDTQIAKADN